MGALLVYVQPLSPKASIWFALILLSTFLGSILIGALFDAPILLCLAMAAPSAFLFEMIFWSHLDEKRGAA